MEEGKGGVKKIIVVSQKDVARFCPKCNNTGLIECFDYGEGYKYYRDCDCKKNETKFEFL